MTMNPWLQASLYLGLLSMHMNLRADVRRSAGRSYKAEQRLSLATLWVAALCAVLTVITSVTALR